MNERCTRRDFVKAAAAWATVSVVPGRVLGADGGTPPSETLNLAGIGVGGVGFGHLQECAQAGFHVAALCDVDDAMAKRAFDRWPEARRYRDFREMLQAEGDLIDAVYIATPDHTHAVATLAALRAGKHVCCVKPLTRTVHEARVVVEAARKAGVATQVTASPNTGEVGCRICELIDAGAIGPVREVHTWTNRPVWPQGIEVDRPKETPAVPASLDWDQWIGPAPYRPYHPEYHPNKWRAWWDFGTGSLGDLGCHIVDPAFWALKLKYPTSVEGCISTYWEGFWKKTEPKNETYPRSTIVRFRFPSRDGMPEVKLTWWDGGMMPPRPDELDADHPMGDEDGGVLFIGDGGSLMCGCYGRRPTLLPKSKMDEYRQPTPTLRRIPNGDRGHEQDWVRACKGGPAASSNFDYSGPLSEAVLMGNLAVRYPNRKLLWDGEKMEVTNDPDANAYVRREYRKGWSL